MSQRSSRQLQLHQLQQHAWRALWCLIVVALVSLQRPAHAGSPWRRGAAEGPLLTHHLSKRSFFDIQCKGVYDKTIFAKLDRICEDCYNLFREPQVHSLCMSQCFTSEYFNGCVESLLMSEEMPSFRKMIEYLAK